MINTGKFQWFRLYSEAANDPKLNFLSDVQFRIWFKLLCIAAEQEERGTIQEEPFLLAIKINCSEELLNSTIELLTKLRIISAEGEKITFVNFLKRQYEKPSSNPEAVKERVKRYRDKKEEEGELPENYNANVTPCNANVTPCNANVTPLKRNETHILRSDTDQIRSDQTISDQKIEATDKEICPLKEIVNLYNEMLTPEFSKAIWPISPVREKFLRARWSDDKARQKIDFWKDFFKKIKESDFLCGRVAGKDGNYFKYGDFEWILRPDNFNKILEGKYNKNGKQVTSNGADETANGGRKNWGWDKLKEHILTPDEIEKIETTHTGIFDD